MPFLNSMARQNNDFTRAKLARQLRYAVLAVEKWPKPQEYYMVKSVLLGRPKQHTLTVRTGDKCILLADFRHELRLHFEMAPPTRAILHIHHYLTTTLCRQPMIQGIELLIEIDNDLLTLRLLQHKLLSKGLLTLLHMFAVLSKRLRGLLYMLLLHLRSAAGLLYVLHQVQHLIFNDGDALFSHRYLSQYRTIFLIGSYLVQPTLSFAQLGLQAL
jgi:hypothetical protein